MTQNVINTSMVLSQRVFTSTGALVTCSTTMPNDNSIPINTEGTQVLSLSITPRSATSTLVIDFSSVATLAGGASGGPSTALFQDSNANALAARCIQATSYLSKEIIFRHIMVSGTTSSTTFYIRVGANSGTLYINGSTAGARLDGGVSNTILIISEYL